MSTEVVTLSPSPWFREGWSIRSAEGSIVAEVLPWDPSGCREEDQGNVNVMTASPRLYLDLKYALECVQQGQLPPQWWIDRAALTIADAEGDL